MNEPIIQVSNLGKRYKLKSSDSSKEDTLSGLISTKAKSTFSKGKKKAQTLSQEFWALKNVSFNVHKGDRIGIIGHNGAGKSTLLKIFSKITAPTEGSIRIQGRVSSLLEVGTGFHPELTGRENIYLNGAILGMTRAEINQKFNDIVEFSEIEQFLDTPVKRYSSGMYVRLAFAVAAHLDPDILVVDEVLAVGDMKFQQKCLGKMSEVSGEGRTVLYVSHSMNTIQQLCNRAIVMDHGTVIFDGDVDDAIKIYMNNNNNMQTYTNLEVMSRPDNINKHATMLDVALIDKEDCIYKNGEVMKFKLRWRANQDLNPIYARLEIMYADNTPAGMTTSKAFNNATKGQITENTFSFDIGNLAPGKYQVTIALYNMNEFGTYENLDKVISSFSFEIFENNTSNNMTWLHRWWGHVKLPELIIHTQ
jgi:lipopolysaccharide transport system ATP-binding protein